MQHRRLTCPFIKTAHINHKNVQERGHGLAKQIKKVLRFMLQLLKFTIIDVNFLFMTTKNMAARNC